MEALIGIGIIVFIGSLIFGSSSSSGGDSDSDKCPNCGNKNIGYYDCGDDSYMIKQGYSYSCGKCGNNW